MPTYEYACQACEHAFERFQSMTAKPVRKCPKCGLNKVRRLISRGAGILFKGSGFYQTDYRSSSYKQGVQKETQSTTKPASTKKDSKPAKTTEKKAS